MESLWSFLNWNGIVLMIELYVKHSNASGVFNWLFYEVIGNKIGKLLIANRRFWVSSTFHRRITSKHLQNIIQSLTSSKRPDGLCLFRGRRIWKVGTIVIAVNQIEKRHKKNNGCGRKYPRDLWINWGNFAVH